MDRDGWIKVILKLSNKCSASPVNNNILFFDGHNIHFDNHAPTQIQKKNTQYFILKVGDSINDHTNDNMPNEKLKDLYNNSKDKRKQKYGPSGFQHHHTNSVLVETW